MTEPSPDSPSDPKTDSASDPKKWEDVVGSGLFSLGRAAITIGSGIVTVGAASYMLGWSAAREYFAVFGMEWLLPHCTSFHLLAFAWEPAYLLLFFGFTATLDIFDTPNVWLLKAPIARFLLPVVLVVAALTAFVTWLESYPEVQAVIQLVRMFAWVLAAAEAFALLVASAGAAPTVLGGRILIACFLLAAAFYFVPSASGRLQGMRDADPERSTLPCVEFAADGEIKQERLLLASEGLVFSVTLKPVDSRRLRTGVLEGVTIRPGSACERE